MINSNTVTLGNSLIAKLPQDFCDKHPGLIFGSIIIVITLPVLCRGAKYVASEISKDFRYLVDAKYGNPATVIIEAAEPESLKNHAID